VLLPFSLFLLYGKVWYLSSNITIIIVQLYIAWLVTFAGLRSSVGPSYATYVTLSVPLLDIAMK
jgi:hypothetical protein